MNISSIMQNIYTSNTSTRSTQNTQTLTDLYKALNNEEDSASFSTEGLALSKMPPPPPETDFSNMSDEELTSFLQQMQEKTGSIPGVEEGTSVSDLTSEQLQSIRELLTDMSERMKGMQGKGGMQGSPPPMDIQNMSDDNLKALLEEIKEKTGSIPGVEDSESVEVSSLTDEQLQSARDALEKTIQEQMKKMMQSMTMNHAISSYNNVSALSMFK